ncbi:MAG: FecR domain-containing protein [Pseudomonadota bacterium]
MDRQNTPLEETSAQAAESIADALEFLRGEADAAGLSDVSELIRQASAKSRQHSSNLSPIAGATPDPREDPALVRPRPQRRYHIPLAAAAGLTAVAVGFLLFSPAPVYEASYHTAVGQHREFTLPDDSVLTLNTNSQVVVRYSGDERQVRLKRGEAHFDVAPAPARPFIVAAGSGTLRAVGTEFNVHLNNGKLEVIVEEGAVEVKADAQLAAAPQLLEEGQMLEYRDTIGIVSMIDDDEIARRLAWHDGMLDFQDSTLAEVIEEAGRHTSTRIVIVDPELESLIVTGYIRAGDIDTLLGMLTQNERISVHRLGTEEVHLTAVLDSQ